MMFIFAILSTCLYLIHPASSSTLTAPPQSALLVTFESAYDTSLLANTLSDQGIDSIVIVPAAAADDVYDNLIDVEIIKLNVSVDRSAYPEAQALQLCKGLLGDEQIFKKIREFQPTYTIFPALRHDGCLLPWVRYIESIPVIWTRNLDEELYVFDATGVALPTHNDGFWSRLSMSFSWRTISSTAKNSYVTPALRLAAKYLSNVNVEPENLYSEVRLVLWGADTVLRSQFASLTQLLVEIGCHHCRGPHPLPGDLQKSLVEYRLGSVIVLLDDGYEHLVRELAESLPQGREGQAVVWKNKRVANVLNNKPENLFVHGKVDRQDLIGYARSRVLLSHCADTELLEAAFHGTPVICFPRNAHEAKNTARAVDLGFARSVDDIRGTVSGKTVADIVSHIHETGEYRENARRTSLAIRDRLNPASDRLVYWLSYVARTKGESVEFLTPKGHSRTLTEDFQFFLGLFVGCVLGVVIATGCFVLRYVLLSGRSQRSKGRYTR